ncbi:MAG: hypothetical protein ACR2H3_08250 [Acidimicrobiales bacterium]
MTAAVVGLEAHTEFEGRRAARRLADWNIIDALYKAYMTALVGGIGVLAISGWVSGDPLAAAQVETVGARGAGVLGLALASAAWIGIRSGRRGGPLSVEPALVRTVLLSPVDRQRVLRPAALRQLRFGLFGGLLAGGVVGTFAFRRLPGAPVGWIVVLTAFGATTGGLGVGTALLVAGRKVPRWSISTAIALLGIGSLADVLLGTASAPLSMVGRLAISPLGVGAEPTLTPIVAIGGAGAGLLAGLVLPVLGLAWIGGLSVEAAERRSRLVALLRFAVTMRDLRAVILFRRALGQERPRSKPWFRFGLSRAMPIAHRDLQGALRWPVPRLLRLATLGAVTGAAATVAMEGPAELGAIAAFALFIAATEVTEGLAQEVDHPSLRASLPVDDSYLWVRHLVVPAIAMAGVGGCAVAASAAMVGSNAVAGLLVVIPGAVVSVAVAAWVAVREPPEPTLQLMDPTGAKVIFDFAIPPAMAGSAPLVLLIVHRVAPQLDLWAAARVAASIEAFLVVGTVGWLVMPHPKGGMLASVFDPPQRSTT